MTTIRANVTRMFLSNEPWDCSNSQANLGDQAGRLTWLCATAVAQAHVYWLETHIGEAIEGIREDARESGWDREEIAAWSDIECLAYFVQTIAGELRMLGSDDEALTACAAKYADTDWDNESEYPRGSYEIVDDTSVYVDFYTGI